MYQKIVIENTERKKTVSNLEEEFENLNLRILAYGPSKARKTWWACTAAEAGFNVILLNADNNISILKNLSPEAKKRIAVVNIHDSLTDPCCSVFLTMFLSGRKFVWDNKARKIVTPMSKVNIEHPHFVIDASKLDSNTVLILDSWTRNAHSLFVRYCKENKINMSKAEEADNRWEGFRYTKALAEWQLNQLQDLGSHVITIGHQSNYEKSRDEKSSDGRIRKIVEWSRVQPISTSGPAAMLLSNHFSDVFYFEISGEMTRIDTTPSKNRDGGSTIVPPGKYDFNPKQSSSSRYLDFAKLCEFANITLPGSSVPEQTAFNYLKPGEEIPFEELQSKVLQTNKKIVSEAAGKKPMSLSTLTKS